MLYFSLIIYIKIIIISQLIFNLRQKKGRYSLKKNNIKKNEWRGVKDILK